ncbi:MAG: aspartate carbamoyltransferase [Oscillospiraceae bacterium]|nr:aspartate carbamoyltransferase [Oscillospiraceae bacterium]
MLNNLIDFNDLSLSEWENLFSLGVDIYANPAKYSERCKGKILATLFYEPSTRTKFSFQAAIIKLGGNVIGFDGIASSSVSKGESLRDTVKIVANYADAIVIRNANEGAAFAASLYSEVPIINAGDGGHFHPTQTMTDLFTIGTIGNGENKKLTGLDIGICGDLLNGRTVHSLLRAFSLYGGNTFYFISTPSLQVPEIFVSDLRKNNAIIICGTIEECIGKLDVLYMTRIQRERFADKAEYEKQRGIYILDKEKLSKAKDDLIILHPLPKNEEISPEVDDDERAKYFKQAELGLYIRMALLIKIFENAGRKEKEAEKIAAGFINSVKRCANPKCITQTEKYLPNIVKPGFGEVSYCAYCEHKI